MGTLQLKHRLWVQLLNLNFFLVLHFDWRGRGVLAFSTVVSRLGLFGNALTVTIVFFENVGDSGEADVVLLDQLRHLDVFYVEEPGHVIFDLYNKRVTSSLILR